MNADRLVRKIDRLRFGTRKKREMQPAWKGSNIPVEAGMLGDD